MSDQEINTAIAEECGWTKVFSDEWGPLRGLKSGDKFYTGCVFTIVPDYCNDLNAMHEEIMSLEGPIRDHSFRRALAKSVGVIGFEDWEHSLVCLDKLTNATASQRAEAFLRTIGKWKEETK